jgi:hypothetical protein
MISIDEPVDFSAEQSAWLRRLIAAVNQEGAKNIVLPVNEKLPAIKYSEGSIRYFSEAIGSEIPAPGLYYYGRGPANPLVLKWNQLQTV